jgi:glycyl-tRNA synthetase beta chain
LGGELSTPEIDAIADAVRDHYKPLGPSDSVPTAPVAAAVALADKLDTLIGFFAIDEKPTGSRDPFGLRRAALGVIRLLLLNSIRCSAHDIAAMAKRAFDKTGAAWRPTVDEVSLTHEFVDFLADRLKVLLRDDGKRHDLVDAVFALGDDDLVRIVARVEALDAFLKTDDGASLLAGYKRASNILRIEEKKDGASYAGASETLPGSAPEETALMAALATASPQIDADLAQEDYTAAMIALSKLRRPLDDFFAKVFVNDPDFAVRRNRLLLLSQIRAASDRIADFSRIAG